MPLVKQQYFIDYTSNKHLYTILLLITNLNRGERVDTEPTLGFVIFLLSIS